MIDSFLRMLLRSIISLIAGLAFLTEVLNPSSSFVRARFEPVHHFVFKSHRGGSPAAPVPGRSCADDYVVCSAEVITVLLPGAPLGKVHVPPALAPEPSGVTLESFQRPPSFA